MQLFSSFPEAFQAVTGQRLKESNEAVYLGDAWAQVLPLVGGGDHDWNWLLSKAGLLARCEAVASRVHFVASLAVLACLAAALRDAFRKTEEEMDD